MSKSRVGPLAIWCSRELIRSPVYFGLCTTEKLFHRELKKLDVPRNDWPSFLQNSYSHATVHTFQKSDGKICMLVCIKWDESHTGIEIASLIVHEAVHIWQEIRSNIGEKEPSSEFEAYSIQHISQELMISFQAQTENLECK